MSKVPIAGDYIKAEGKAGRMGAKLMAIVAEGDRGRVYLAPTQEHESIVHQAEPTWMPDVEIPPDRRSMFTPLYGLTHFKDLFTDRQLVALTTFSDLVGEARERICADAVAAGMPDDGAPVRDDGIGAMAYAEAVGVYLAFALSKQADLATSLCRWEPIAQCPRQLFARQAIPMVWDYAEGNPLGASSGAWNVFIDGIAKAFEKAFQTVSPTTRGFTQQHDAGTQRISKGKIVSTDPPYYDNVGYADLSDFFYVWLRRSLGPVFPNLFATLAAPKVEELVATPYRHKGKADAESFFLNGMTEAMRHLANQSHLGFPVTIYYAFKQSEVRSESGISNTGWATFLDAAIKAGYGVTGTWPVRTENGSRMTGQGTNALASSIVLVCRPRSADAPIATRREFVDALGAELPEALRQMQQGNIAPVDLAQAAIGPGMAVFTQYAKVLDASGEDVSVREALALINQTLDEVLAEQEGDFDADTRWALAWFEQSGFVEGDFGVAETLSKAKNTSVPGMVDTDILTSGGGKVRLLLPNELPANWDPENDPDFTIWEATHQLIRLLGQGEPVAAETLAKLGARTEAARDLAYRLYRMCDQNGRSQDAQMYNGLVQSWPEIARLAQQTEQSQQRSLMNESGN